MIKGAEDVFLSMVDAEENTRKSFDVSTVFLRRSAHMNCVDDIAVG